MAANYYKYNANMNDRTYFTSVIVDTAGNAKRYFSNVESEIYFGDKEMDDLYQFEFSIDEKVLPIYGYNCYYATELVSEQRIVQGQFVVNFTDNQLIKSTLGSIDDSIYKENNGGEYLPGGDLHHAIYDKEFDIMIGYGYYDMKDKQTYNATSQTILGAKISGMHKIMDTTGQPLMEVYTFIAKDFVEENITESTTGNDGGNGKDNNNDASLPELALSYVCSDAYNAEQISKNDAYVKKHVSCEHFINNLCYNDGMISLMVKSGKNHKLTLVSGSVEITDHLSEDVIIPLLSFTSVSKTSAQIKLDKKYESLINKKKTEYGGKINCVIKYRVKIANKNNLVKEFEVIQTNAILYI